MRAPWLQADPAQNFNFSRRWVEKPPDIRKSPRAGRHNLPRADFVKADADEYITPQTSIKQPLVIVYLSRKFRIRPEVGRVIAESLGWGGAR